jgi:pantothenate kinase type III
LAAVQAATIASGVPVVTDALIRAVRLYLDFEPSVITVENQPLLTTAYATPGDLGVDRKVTAGDNFTPAGIYYAFRESHGRATL